MEVIYGSTQKRVQIDLLIQAIERIDEAATFYIGYPILATIDEAISIDALLVSNKRGLVIFSIPNATNNSEQIKDEQDKLYFSMQGMLSKYPGLRKGRELAFTINVISFIPDMSQSFKTDILIASASNIQKVLNKTKPFDPQYSRPLNAALQRVSSIKPTKKRSKVSEGTKGAIIKKVESEIANLDQWQKHAAIETPTGPQRIRGLAGSGKTIVLALKAAYLHTQHPDWNIVLTFHSRSLYQQLIDLVERFTFEHQGDKPNYEKLRIMHAWGGADRQGLYTEMATMLDTPVHTFLYGKSRYGMNRAFEGVCNELLAHSLQTENIEPCYDAVLVDEAQDLTAPFFRLVHRFCKEPKRIIWAYDELQNLSDSVMPTVNELFGETAKGDPLVTISNVQGQPRQDIVLPVCYRNTPWALTLAHALGLGIYRKGGLVQHFDDLSLWSDVGYYVESGSLEFGSHVKLKRRQDSYPEYFTDLLKPEDSIKIEQFEDEEKQAAWITDQIYINLTDDQLEPDDILIIIPDTIRAKGKAAIINQALSKKKINTHLVGVTSSSDHMFVKTSVAIANIYRAKGNEAPMVYIADSQFCYSGYELTKLRNILFTAITRSRAWVRICGYGNEMDLLSSEINKVIKKDFKLSFKIPTENELKTLRQIHRDRTAEEKRVIQKAEKGLIEFLDSITKGDVSIDSLPLRLKTKLRKLLRQEDEDDYIE